MFNFSHSQWHGCFGCQSYINHKFLLYIEKKYNISYLIKVIKSRPDRCCLERIFGCIFFTECPEIIKTKSICGNIYNYQKWGYNYETYIDDFKKRIINKPIIKVWTGR
jgi:hypothetical protein